MDNVVCRLHVCSRCPAISASPHSRFLTVLYVCEPYYTIPPALEAGTQYGVTCAVGGGGGGVSMFLDKDLSSLLTSAAFTYYIILL